MSHFEVVQTDAEQPWHLRLVGSNGEPVMVSENYTDPRTAENAIAVAAEAFGVTIPRDPEWVGVTELVGYRSNGARVYVQVRHVDERDA